ncbi:CDP-diacylglycerol--glycerol-3-phosphate 3-phosphatidyltransferase [Clostridia bacterium]|nr:CDP-diacylglycerol--glycerol-3-phosphate 3-phosphatidyltransferase [Clostridia bacterium]
MSRINWPNRLTLARIALVPVYLVLLRWSYAAQSQLWFVPTILAFMVLCVAALTDLLDGIVARRLDEQSTAGKFLDPIADKLLVIPALIWFTAIGRLTPWPVILIAAREFIVDALRLLAMSNGVVLAAAFSGKVKTVSQLILLGFLTVPEGWHYSVPILAWICAALAIGSALEYFLKNRSLITALFTNATAIKEQTL